MKKRIVFTGGGTVGHVTLNLVLMPKFIKDGWDVHYIGNKHGIEYQEIKRMEGQVTFHNIATGKLRRYFSFQNMLDVFKVSFGVLQSLAILARLRPQAVFSKGGFVSVPPVVAAGLLHVPVYIHESDLSMGLANRIAFKFATKLYTTFNSQSLSPKIQHIGAVTKIKKGQSFEGSSKLEKVKTMFASDLPTLLFIGGSGGAKVFNDFITQHNELLDKYNIINITGDASLESLSSHLYRVSYVTEDYLPLMALADVVVTRGGSNTLFELLALNKLHVIVPLEKGSRGDQVENAHYFEEKGYAKVLKENNLTPGSLTKVVTEILTQADSFHKKMEVADEVTSPEDFYQTLLEAIKLEK